MQLKIMGVQEVKALYKCISEWWLNIGLGLKLNN